jgi:hypothetical protein
VLTGRIKAVSHHVGAVNWPTEERTMFRFTIRDLLWLTVVVSLAIGWGMQIGRLNADLTHSRNESQSRHSANERLRRDIDDIREQLERHGFTVTWRTRHRGNALIDMPVVTKADQ